MPPTPAGCRNQNSLHVRSISGGEPALCFRVVRVMAGVRLVYSAHTRSFRPTAPAER